jgi:hypothetical protein
VEHTKECFVDIIEMTPTADVFPYMAESLSYNFIQDEERPMTMHDLGLGI